MVALTGGWGVVMGAMGGRTGGNGGWVRFILRLGSRLVGTGGDLGGRVDARCCRRVFQQMGVFIVKWFRLQGGTSTFGGSVGLCSRFVGPGGDLGGGVAPGGRFGAGLSSSLFQLNSSTE